MKQVVRICGVALMLAVCAPVFAQDGRQDAADADTIITKSGRRMHCTVLGIEPKGGVRFTAAWLRGEAWADMNAVRRLMLKRADVPTGRDVMVITNGDIIDGDVLAITAKHVTIDTGIMGQVKVPMRVVEQIAFGSAGRYIGMTDMAGGDSERWQMIRGAWWFADDRLHCRGLDYRAMIAVPVEHDGSVTVVFRGVSPSSGPVPWGLDMFARNFEEYSSTGCMRADFGMAIARGRFGRGPEGRLFMSPDGQTGPCAGEFRVAYDAKRCIATIWVNDTQVASSSQGNVLHSGTHIVLAARGPGHIGRVRVYPGVVPPGMEITGKGEKDEHVLVMLNGSRAKCPQFNLKDGQYTMRVRDEELPVPADRVTHIVTAGGGRVRPVLRKGSVHAVAGRLRVTLRITGLKDGHLAGHCEYLGDVRIARQALEYVESVRVAPEAEAPEAGQERSTP